MLPGMTHIGVVGRINPMTQVSQIGFTEAFGFGSPSGVPAYPTGIKAGDFLLGLTNTDPNTTFRSASGFTNQWFHSDNGSTGLFTKLATGAESGAIGGFTNYAYPLSEVCVLLRGNVPITKITRVAGLYGGYRSAGQPTTLTIAGTTSNTAKARLAIVAFACNGTFNNANIAFNGTGFDSTNYSVGTTLMKTRIAFWPAGTVGQDLSATKYDTGSDNAVWGAIFELN